MMLPAALCMRGDDDRGLFGFGPRGLRLRGRAGCAPGFLAFLALFLLFSPRSEALSLTLNPGAANSSLQVNVLQNTGATTHDILNPATLPYQDDHSVVDQEATASAQYDLTSSSFDVDFDLGRGATGRTEAAGTIRFSVDEVATYTIAGAFAMSGPEVHHMSFEMYLRDLTGSKALYHETKLSLSTPDESFVAGVPGGDASDDQVGQLSGELLLPGREYSFGYRFIDRRAAGAALVGPYSGGGEVSFAVVPSVPEPAWSVLLGLGLALLPAAKWCRGPRR